MSRATPLVESERRRKGDERVCVGMARARTKVGSKLERVRWCRPGQSKLSGAKPKNYEAVSRFVGW